MRRHIKTHDDIHAAIAATRLHVGCAGWSIPRAVHSEFPDAGSHLMRYAHRLVATEINSSFYKPHRASTYARWAESVPRGFRFSVKMPKTITHELRLIGATELLSNFLRDVSALGDKLGCLLVQLPPSLVFDDDVARKFFEGLKSSHDGAIAFEPRHASWFAADADRIYNDYSIARVAADPSLATDALQPGAASDMAYFRLHGSPRTYYSAYDHAFLATLANTIQRALSQRSHVWCIFDNTTLGAALPNALELMQLLQPVPTNG